MKEISKIIICSRGVDLRKAYSGLKSLIGEVGGNAFY
jgi:hypothetical protein